jgi:esterase/lipase superfamily enzyme
MLEPALVFDVDTTVDSALEHLRAYSQFKYVVVRMRGDPVTHWFALSSNKVRWLLEGESAQNTLGAALSLTAAESSATYEGALQNIPAGFVGVILAEGEAFAVAYEPDTTEKEAVRAPLAAPEVPRAPTPTAAGPSGFDGEPASAQAAIELESVRRPNVAVVPVFYATDREATGAAGPTGLFGSRRGPLQFGKIEVSIPPGHERGAIETPSWWRLEFRPNAAKHIVLQRAVALDSAGFRAALHAEPHAGKQALIFVHGYNVGFDAAVLRTAQIAHDLRFDGASILYSWPSDGTVLGYAHDENNARWTEPHFAELLRLLMNDQDLESVHVICHSMGNRVVVEALRTLPLDIDTRKLKQLILAAPDIDADTFSGIATAFQDKAEQVTLYASSHDLALRASKLIHGYPRAGDTDPRVLIVKSIVTVDASRVDTNLLGHSYIGDSTSILADVDSLIRTGLPPDQRTFFLDSAELDGERYWVFVP